MASGELERVALTLVADGEGILAADESVPTLTRRFDILGIQSTEQSRRTYREMLFTSHRPAPRSSSAARSCMNRQKSSRGTPLTEALAVQGVLPGIKVDTGAKRPLREVARCYPRPLPPCQLQRCSERWEIYG
jgi:fructose-bisphosphate aldolase class I